MNTERFEILLNEGIKLKEIHGKLTLRSSESLKTLDFSFLEYVEVIELTHLTILDDGMRTLNLSGLKKANEISIIYCYGLNDINLNSLISCNRILITGIINLRKLLIPNLEELYDFGLTNLDLNLISIPKLKTLSRFKANYAKIESIDIPKLKSINSFGFKDSEKLKSYVLRTMGTDTEK